MLRKEFTVAIAFFYVTLYIFINIFPSKCWTNSITGLSLLASAGKNNRFPFLDILGYLKNTHENPKLEEWDESQPGNLVGNSPVGTCLTLPNLRFLWVFFKYPKISKNGNLLFFPV